MSEQKTVTVGLTPEMESQLKELAGLYGVQPDILLPVLAAFGVRDALSERLKAARENEKSRILAEQLQKKPSRIDWPSEKKPVQSAPKPISWPEIIEALCW